MDPGGAGAYTRVMRTVAFLSVALAFVALPLQAEVDVQYKGGRVDVRASAAPLSEVLDRLARATGMKVVQQGSNPTMLVSLSLANRTPAEAVFGVLEGLGLNYAFVLDVSGNRIETLVLAGASGTKVATSAPPAPAAAPRYVPQRPAPPPASGPDDAEEEEADVPGDEGEEPAEEVDEDAANEAPAAAAPGPRGNVLKPPAEPVFPSSPFAPRAPMFTPQPEPPPQQQPQPTPTPAPPKPNQP
jgi:hypothetical protein